MVLKYKQALRGLFTAGTSLPNAFGKQKKRSVANRDRCRYIGSPYNHAGQKPQINERNYWKKDWDDQHLHSRWKANSLHHY
jgi:hypothetical protein